MLLAGSYNLLWQQLTIQQAIPKHIRCDALASAGHTVALSNVSVSAPDGCQGRLPREDRGAGVASPNERRHSMRKLPALSSSILFSTSDHLIPHGEASEELLAGSSCHVICICPL